MIGRGLFARADRSSVPAFFADGLAEPRLASGAVGAARLLRAVHAPYPRREDRDSGDHVCGPLVRRVLRAHPGLPASILLWNSNATWQAPNTVPLASSRSIAMPSAG